MSKCTCHNPRICAPWCPSWDDYDDNKDPVIEEEVHEEVQAVPSTGHGDNNKEQDRKE